MPKRVSEKDLYISMIVEYYEKLEKESITLPELDLFLDAIAVVLQALEKEATDSVEFNASVVRSDLLQMKEDVELERELLRADPALADVRQERSDKYDDEALLAVEARYGPDDIDPEEEARHALVEQASDGSDDEKETPAPPAPPAKEKRRPMHDGVARPATARSTSARRSKTDPVVGRKRRMAQ